MRDQMVELLTQRAEATSREIHELLHGLGMRTQGAVLADLVSLWLAGMVEESEIAKPSGQRPLTAQVRAAMLDEFIELVEALLPESEKQIIANIEPEGSA